MIFFLEGCWVHLCIAAERKLNTNDFKEQPVDMVQKTNQQPVACISSNLYSDAVVLTQHGSS